MRWPTTAFDHDWARFADSSAQDERAILAIGGALVATAKPLLVTSGFARLFAAVFASGVSRPVYHAVADGGSPSAASPRRSAGGSA